MKKANTAEGRAGGLSNQPRPAPVEAARQARERWRLFVAGHPDGPEADHGRIGYLEAAAEVFRLTGDPADRALAERLAREYLARGDAREPARARAVLQQVRR